MKISYKNLSFINSLRHALNGIMVAFVRERNLKFQLLFGVVVIAAGILCRLSYLEWGVILLVCGLVIVCELINSAVEIAVDLITKKQSIRAKLAKDMCAGAVLVSSVLAIVIGLLVFYNKVIGIGK